MSLLAKLMDKRLGAYQRELIEIHYAEVENMYRQIRGWRHDYRSHIQVMKALAAEEDWDAEYGDYILAVRTVKDPEEAIAFINAHGTGHSEAIITRNYFKAQRFLDAVDAAAVYVNASTRFTDGGEFGLGAEIGISTQKMHARGPMGLEELTSCKYVIYGEGQVR